MRAGHWVSMVLLAVSAATLSASCRAQDSQNSAQADSLAAAARRARQDKKSQTKSAAVFTNDNLPTDAKISIVGSTPAASSDTDASNASAKPAGPQPGAATPSDDKKAAETAGALAAAKEKLASLKKDLDILERKFNLDQQAYLSNPNHGSDTAGADALEAEQAAIKSKQEEVDNAQKEVDRLTALVPAAPNAPPAGPPTDNSSSPQTPAPGTHPI
jgi:hypothetical protein